MDRQQQPQQNEIQEMQSPAYERPRTQARPDLKGVVIPITEPGIPGMLKDIDRMRDLEQGWLEDGVGDKPPAAGLDWLIQALKKHYPKDCEVPLAYPTPEGGVNLEWELKPYSAALEVDLKRRRGEWDNLNMKTDEYEEEELDLDTDRGWAELQRLVKQLCSKAG